ncbi:hypothetical protein IGJ47_001811 [Enterococcus sp. AZ172]
MIRKQSIEGRNQFAMLTINDFVPKDHLVRKIDAAIQFDFIYPIVEFMYSTYGRPSIDPMVLIKLNIYLGFVRCVRPLKKLKQT